MSSFRDLKSIPLPSHWKLEHKQDKGLLLHTGEGRPFGLDFSSFKSLSSHQPLAKAVGYSKKKKIKILDLTAGWGKDAFLLASLGCEVIAIESHPLVFAFLEEAFDKEKLKKPLSLQFILDNSLNYLKTIKEEKKPEVIYIDPMFENGKKSLSQKPLRILKELTGDSLNVSQLFSLALSQASQRVVVKRHRHQKSLGDKNKICSFSGRSVCYDVFAPQEGF